MSDDEIARQDAELWERLDAERSKIERRLQWEREQVDKSLARVATLRDDILKRTATPAQRGSEEGSGETG